MIRPARVLTVAAFAAAAIAGTATPALANPTCNTTSSGTLYITACVATDSPLVRYVDVPIVLGENCVGNVCVDPDDMTVSVPVPDTTPVHVYGTVCYDNPKLNPVCVPFTTDVQLDPASL